MGRPRFLLVMGYRAGAARDSRPGFGPFAGEPSTDGSWVSWRLVGRNNRELARSSHVFASTAGCLETIADLRVRVEEAEALVAVDHATGQWSWRLDLGGALVAVSGRSYQRRREAHYGLGQFLTALADGETTIDTLGRPGPSDLPTLHLAPLSSGPTVRLSRTAGLRARVPDTREQRVMTTALDARPRRTRLQSCSLRRIEV